MGLRLREMEASEMLDVVHYFFDQDNNYSTAEQAEAHSLIRRAVFRDWYGKEYRYGVPEKNNSLGEQQFIPNDVGEDLEESITPVDPFKKASSAGQSKPFVPTTDFDDRSSKPFGSILDAPLG